MNTFKDICIFIRLKIENKANCHLNGNHLSVECLKGEWIWSNLNLLSSIFAIQNFKSMQWEHLRNHLYYISFSVDPLGPLSLFSLGCWLPSDGSDEVVGPFRWGFLFLLYRQCGCAALRLCGTDAQMYSHWAEHDKQLQPKQIISIHRLSCAQVRSQSNLARGYCAEL